MSEIIFSKEYCSNVFDGTHDSPKPCEIGVPLITSKNIVNGCLDFNGAYNISLEDYNKMLINQNNKCDICRIGFNNLVVDHCHTTGKVRGLLCNGCNSGIGFFKENKVTILNSIEYLNKHEK